MNVYKSKISYIRRKLNLDRDVFIRIPDDFILLLFTSQTDIPTRFQLKAYDEYGFQDYENFEFIGDTVLSLIVVNIMIQRGLITSPGRATKIKQLLTNNRFLGTMIDYKNLCQERIPGRISYETSKSPIHICADLFESILGGLYWYLETRLKHRQTIQVLQNWYVNTWPIYDMINKIISRESITSRYPTKSRVAPSSLSRQFEPRPPRQTYPIWKRSSAEAGRERLSRQEIPRQTRRASIRSLSPERRPLGRSTRKQSSSSEPIDLTSSQEEEEDFFDFYDFNEAVNEMENLSRFETTGNVNPSAAAAAASAAVFAEDPMYQTPSSSSEIWEDEDPRSSQNEIISKLISDLEKEITDTTLSEIEFEDEPNVDLNYI